MFLIKIFHFAKGYVILSISGQNKEEFLNRIILRGVKPKNLDFQKDRILVQIEPKDFFKIRNAAKGVRIHIEKKRGLVFLLKRLKARKLFLAGLIAFFLMFAIGSQFIWSVSYEGAENCDKKQLEAAVKLAGLYQGMPKRNLKSGIEMKNIILNHTDNICWAWVYIRGTKAVVEVREDIIPPEVFLPDTPCDIIAMRNGIIKRVIAERGRCLVIENQAVAAGDTIISGTYEFENEPGYQVHSSGSVEAYTEHTKTGTFKQVYCYKKYTGRKRNFFTLSFFKWQLPLYISDKVPFEEYDTSQKEYELKIGKDGFLGVGIKRVECCEFTTEKEPISYDTAVEFAQKKLEAQIAGELLPGAQLVDKNIDVKKIDEETIFVTLTMNFIEKIGTEKRIEVKLLEPKTDRIATGN